MRRHLPALSLRQATRVEVEQDDSVSGRHGKAFYADCFARSLADKPYETALAVYLSMSARAPGWINGLLQLRDRLVLPFGMAPTRGFHAHRQPFSSVERGDALDFFEVVSIDANAMKLQLRDVHFTVFISLDVDQESATQTLYFTSRVMTHSWLGNVYVSLIAPFHRLVVRSLINRLD